MNGDRPLLSLNASADGVSYVPDSIYAHLKGNLSLSANIDPNGRIPDIAGSIFVAGQHNRSARCGASIVFFAKGFVRLEWALIQSIASRLEVNFPK